MIKLDGWITIGTKLSTEKFDKQISDLENKIDSEEKKQELLNNKTKEYENDLANANREVSELTKEYDSATKKAEQLAEALKKAEKVSPRTPRFFEFESDYKEQVKVVDELSAKLDKAEKAQSNLNMKVQQTRLQQESSAKAVDKLRGKIELINLKRQKKEFDGLQKSADSLSKGINTTISKIAKMALAVLSVRSAYSLLRQASSTWGQYNEQYAKDIEYIRFALAYGLAPILEKIVQLVATLMEYINYLSNAWFGKQIFASAKDFEKMQKSAGGVAKSTKEIKNNLASFDELNILGKSNNSGSGFLAPTFDLGNFENVEIPDWIKWLGDNGDKVKSSLIGIGGALGAIKLSELATNLGLVKEKLSLIKGIGVGVAIDGIVRGVKDLSKYVDEPTIENLGKTIADVGEAVVGVGIATGNLPVVVGGALVLLTGKFIENWDEIKDTTQKGIDYLRAKSPEIERIFGQTGEKIYNDVLDTGQDILDTIDTNINAFNENFIAFIDIIDSLASGDWTTAWKRFKDIVKNTWDAVTSIIQTAINSIIRFVNFFLEKAEEFINGFVDALNSLGANIEHFDFGRIPLLGKQNVVSMPTRADLGIQGPELIPSYSSENNGGITDSLMNKIENIKQDITIKVEGSASQLFRYLKIGIDEENNRTGTRIIEGGT